MYARRIHIHCLYRLQNQTISANDHTLETHCLKFSNSNGRRKKGHKQIFLFCLLMSYLCNEHPVSLYRFKQTHCTKLLIFPLINFSKTELQSKHSYFIIPLFLVYKFRQASHFIPTLSPFMGDC